MVVAILAAHVFLTGKAAVVVGWAIDGARQRLASAECQRVFDDFSDQGGGDRLSVQVAAAGKRPADLLDDVYFADGDETTQCRMDAGLAAFTRPGSKVIFICGTRFVAFASKPVRAEILVIHELLHTLGAGENPPSSTQITSIVTNRCG